MSYFAKRAKDPETAMSSANVRGGGNWFKLGSYILEILKVTAGVSKRKKGLWVAVEGRIADVLVSVPEDYEFAGSRGSNREGERVRTVFMIDDNEVALSNYKSFIAACLEIDDNDETAEVIVIDADGEEVAADLDWDELADWAVGAYDNADRKLHNKGHNPLSGDLIMVQGSEYTTKNNNDIVALTFSTFDVPDAEPKPAE